MTSIFFSGSTESTPKYKLKGTNFKKVIKFEASNVPNETRTKELNDITIYNEHIREFLERKCIFNAVFGYRRTFFFRTGKPLRPLTTLVDEEIWAFGHTIPNLEYIYSKEYKNSVQKLTGVNVKAKEIVITGKRMLMLTKSGDIWGIGLNDHFQLNNSINQKFEKPVKVNHDIGPDSSERKVEMALTANKERRRTLFSQTSAFRRSFTTLGPGTLRSVKNGDNQSKSPGRISRMSIRELPKKVAIQFSGIDTNKHCTYYNCKGEIYSMGNKKSGILGIEDISELQSKPLQVHFPLGSVKIMKLSCSDIHVLALDGSGRVYGWGVNINCVIGVKNNLDRVDQKVPLPEPVHILKETKVVDINVSNVASLVTNFRGAVFIWGK